MDFEDDSDDDENGLTSMYYKDYSYEYIKKYIYSFY